MLKPVIRSSIAAIIISLGLILLFVTVSSAEEKEFYIGAGGSFNATRVEHYDGDKVNHDNEFGVNAKFGYRLTRMLFLQLDADYIFNLDDESSIGSSAVDLTSEGSVFTAMASLKGYFSDFVCEACGWKPYLIAGLGLMTYNADVNDAAKTLGYDDVSETDFCYKVGGGLDYQVNEAFSIGLEANYTTGSNNVDNVRYFNFTLGFAYHY